MAELVVYLTIFLYWLFRSRHSSSFLPTFISHVRRRLFFWLRRFCFRIWERRLLQLWSRSRLYQTYPLLSKVVPISLSFNFILNWMVHEGKNEFCAKAATHVYVFLVVAHSTKQRAEIRKNWECARRWAGCRILSIWCVYVRDRQYCNVAS